MKKTVLLVTMLTTMLVATVPVLALDIHGTEADETLHGTSEIVDETMVDSMYGFGGSDYLYGYDGNDFISGDGPPALYQGDDVIYGGPGEDFLSGDAGNDYLYGEDDNDSLSGGPGSDVSYGGSGDDTLSAEADGGIDYLYCGEGYDRYDVAESIDYVDPSCEEDIEDQLCVAPLEFGASPALVGDYVPCEQSVQ